MSIYPYKPLNVAEATRFLTLEPGNYDDSLTGSLSHVALAEKPSYEALSYVWKSSTSNVPPAPDQEVRVALYGTNEQGETVQEVKSVKFKDLANDPNYAHLYHKIGGLYEPDQILCDGLAVEIGGELNRALRDLRLTDKPRTLWVDALCINQDDIEERGKHVQQMARIYAGAEKVLVWLGQAADVDTRAYEALRTLAEELPPFLMETDPSMYRSSFMHHEKFRNLHWDALAELLKRAWFERVWVIQEIANAAEAQMCMGHVICDWDILAMVINLLRKHDLDMFLRARGQVMASLALGFMLNLKRTKDNLQARPSLLDMLIDSRRFKCTLPHDKIYGILGLCKDRDEGYVTVDYGINASKVYTDFTVAHITKTNSLDILYACAKTGETSQLTLPSWVPDWTRPCHHEPYIIHQLGWRAAGDSEMQARFEHGNQSFFVRGQVLDTIADVDLLRPIPRDGKFIPPPLKQNALKSAHLDYMTQAWEHGRDWYTNAIKIAFPKNVCTPQSYEALWRTFTCNMTYEKTTPPASWGQHFSDFMDTILADDDPEKRAAIIERWEKEMRDPWDLREKESNEEALQKRIHMAVGEFNAAFGTWSFHRRFYRTVTRRLGWAPDQARPGDQICIFYGGHTPFVLRPDGQGHHEIVGDVYIHGFMDGEAMAPKDDTKIEVMEHEFHLI